MKFSHKLEMMQKINKIDLSEGAEKACQLIDFHNQQVEKKKEDQYSKDMNDRNLFYWKLWVRAAQELNGETVTKNSFLIK